jgi:hypothetical protein
MFGCNRSALLRAVTQQKARAMLIRASVLTGLMALSLVSPSGAVAQSLPIGNLMNAIGQAQSSAPQPAPGAAQKGRKAVDRAPAATSKGRPSYIIRQERDRNGREIIEYYDHRGIKRTIRDHGGNG